MDNDDINARAASARKGTPFLNTAQAAYYLNLSAATLEDMRGRHQGPSFRRHGRFIRYHIADLDDWSRSNGRAPRDGGTHG